MVISLSEDDLVDRLKRRGWRLSAQRRVVAEVLRGDHVHLTAEEIFDRSQTRLQEISQATVYNTLRELVSMGEVRVVSAGDGIKRYDPNVGVDHHHLLCTSCQRLRDVHPLGLERVKLPPAERYGYVVSGAELVFKGLCPECQGSTAGSCTAK